MTESVSSGSPEGRLLYSVEEAAGVLGIGRTFMFRLVIAGEIESIKIGKRRKVPRDALNRYIARLSDEQVATTNGSAGST